MSRHLPAPRMVGISVENSRLHKTSHASNLPYDHSMGTPLRSKILAVELFALSVVHSAFAEDCGRTSWEGSQ